MGKEIKFDEDIKIEKHHLDLLQLFVPLLHKVVILVRSLKSLVNVRDTTVRLWKFTQDLNLRDKFE